METVQIVGGILLILACILIILVVLVQDSKDPGMSAAIGGGSNQSFYGKNGSRTKEVKIQRITKIAAFIFFVATLVVNFLTIKN